MLKETELIVKTKDQQITYPLASVCQYGANSPENAGTKYVPAVLSTLPANFSAAKENYIKLCL